MSQDNELSYSPEFGVEKRPPCQLYLISPVEFDVAAHAETLQAVLAADAPVAAYQLRLKNVPDEAILEAAAVLLPICQEADVAFILNDRADLAKACGADGVHLGQEDGSVKDALKLMGKDAQIGVTCSNSRHWAMEAGEAGASYVAFGAFFPTTTKKVKHEASPDLLRWWVGISPIPCVAIGGITADNCRPLVEAGADFLAVSAGVWAAENPVAAVEAFARQMA